MVQTFLDSFRNINPQTWAPVLFGWGSLAQFLHSEWDQTLFRASWELCYRQLYLSLISPLPQSLFPPSPPSHHRTLLHHACNYGATGEMSVAKFSLAVSVGNRGFRAIQLNFWPSDSLAVEPDLWWSWSGGLIVESQPLSLARTCHLCLDYESHFCPYVTICLVPALHDMTFNLCGHLSLCYTVCSFSTFVFSFY